MQASVPRINWPADLEPDQCPVHQVNRLEILAPASEVFALLVDAQTWPDWYPNSWWVDLGETDRLEYGLDFKWWTFGVPVRCTVADFEPPHHIAWTGDALGTHVHHAWILESTARGTVVRTEESQRGWAPSLIAPILRQGLKTMHQLWLERMALRLGVPGVEPPSEMPRSEPA